MTDQPQSGFHPDFLKHYAFCPVIDIGKTWNVLDLSKGYDPGSITLNPPSIGRYNEKRQNMYTTEQYRGTRNIHVGIDFWVPAGTPVCSFYEGNVLFYRDNAGPGDYGPTIVTEHPLGEHRMYALFGHLTRESLDHVYEGMLLACGKVFANVGDKHENGGWVSHLHFQISLQRPTEPDMPGVVSEDELPEALKTWPDPQWILGRLY